MGRAGLRLLKAEHDAALSSPRRLDTIAPRVLVISPPATDTILRKRFQYGEKFARRALPTEAYVRATFSEDVEESLPVAADFFASCDESVHQDARLAEQYEAVANGN